MICVIYIVRVHGYFWMVVNEKDAFWLPCKTSFLNSLVWDLFLLGNWLMKVVCESLVVLYVLCCMHNMLYHILLSLHFCFSTKYHKSSIIVNHTSFLTLCALNMNWTAIIQLFLVQCWFNSVQFNFRYKQHYIRQKCNYLAQFSSMLIQFNSIQFNSISGISSTT